MLQAKRWLAYDSVLEEANNSSLQSNMKASTVPVGKPAEWAEHQDCVTEGYSSVYPATAATPAAQDTSTTSSSIIVNVLKATATQTC